LLRFEVVPIREVYNSEDFKVYGCISSSPETKKNKYGNVSIVGDFQRLTLGVKYKVRANEVNGKNGYSYEVEYIGRDFPENTVDVKEFLSEILTAKQAETLFKAYPDILVRIMKDNTDDIDFTKTRGIKEKTFEKIKKKVIENFGLIELVDKFKNLMTIGMMKKMVDKYQTPMKVLSKFKHNPYTCLTAIDRIGFLTADSLVLKVQEMNPSLIAIKEPLLGSQDRMTACILHLLKENETKNGNTKIEVDSLYIAAEAFTSQCMQYFDTVLDECPYIYKDEEFVALHSTYRTEERIAHSINNLRTYKTHWHIDIEKYRNIKEGVTATDNQLKAVANVCKFNVSILNGYAGSGKTETINMLTKVLKDHDKTFIMITPTAKAANVLKRGSYLPAYTIHRGLGYNNGEWTYDLNNPINADLVIIDESSMVDVRIMLVVLNAIDPRQTKLLLVGDAAQIPSVGAGNVFHDLIASKKIACTTLDQVFRYKDGGLMAVNTWIRERQKYLQDKAIQIFGENKDYAFISSRSEDILANVEVVYRQLMDSGVRPESIYVLSFSKKGQYGTVELNRLLQKIANPNNAYNNASAMSIGDDVFYRNDLVMQIKNNYSARIFGGCEDDVTLIANGETGRILDISNKHMMIQFEDHKVIYEKNEVMDFIQLGYSMTMHKSQGSEVKYNIIVTPSAHSYYLNSNLLYVATTRTRERCYHIGNIDTVNRAIKVKANFKRKTFLKDLLLT
jgi:exodeoxyribonuclease V alpha subunit